MVRSGSSPGIVAFLNTRFRSHQVGVEIYTLISLVILLVSAPFVHWISMPDAGALAAAIKMKTELAASGYSLFNLLSFVQVSKMGVLGLTAMVLFLMMAASVILHILTIIPFFQAEKSGKARLSQMVLAQAAMLLSIFSAIGTIAYVAFANKQFTMQGFVPTIAVYAVLVLAIVAMIAIKVLEKQEQRLSHEHGMLTEIRKNGILFVFLIPGFVYLIINNYLPMVGIYFAFVQFNFRDGLFNSPFTGFKNFEFLLRADLVRLTKNTVLYNLVFIVVGNILQIFFAILVSRVGQKNFRKVSQTLIFMPYFVSYVILRVLVYNLFEYNFGIINTYLAGAGAERLDFYNTPIYWPFIITIFYLWKGLGYGMVIYLATIMGISTEYYDAAKVDGASIIQEIRFITVPLLKPTFIILLLYALGSIMKGQFELFYQIIGNNGVLFNATDILDTYVYRITTTQPLSMGLGTAAGLFQSVFGFVVIVVTNYLIKRKNSEYALF